MQNKSENKTYFCVFLSEILASLLNKGKGSNYKFRSRVKAFTLIELLVVVLIIGILTAIAIPQYQKAVARSRVAEVFLNFKSISNAQSVYHMANGTCTIDLDTLGVAIQKKYYDYHYKVCGTNSCCLYAHSNDSSFPSFEGPISSNSLYCRGTAKQCKLVGAVELASWCKDSSCDYYILHL